MYELRSEKEIILIIYEIHISFASSHFFAGRWIIFYIKVYSQSKQTPRQVVCCIIKFLDDDDDKIRWFTRCVDVDAFTLMLMIAKIQPCIFCCKICIRKVRSFLVSLSFEFF